MQKIAIIGSGPTGVYTLFSLIENHQPADIAIYERNACAGVGMPYTPQENSRLMLANIASIEIPPLCTEYLHWLQAQADTNLACLGVDKKSLHDRQFLPRVLLGEFFRAQFLEITQRAVQRGFQVHVHENSELSDIEVQDQGVRLWVNGKSVDACFDMAVLATGHVWPEGAQHDCHYFPSPWSGLLQTQIPPCRVGIMGTSLSAIDAAMAVAAQHGYFIEASASEPLQYILDEDSGGLRMVLMSRSGILPEADFYCPIPYEPLCIATVEAISAEIARGRHGLLERVFTLLVREIQTADPAWSARIGLEVLDVDSFYQAYFQDRQRHDASRWASYNLAEVEHNRQGKQTVAWRYAILRLHEAIQEIVPHLDAHDYQRFKIGLGKVFVDNYAAIPPESVRRLLALRQAGVIEAMAVGQEYEKIRSDAHTTILVDGQQHDFDVFIDARGQRALEINDLPFPRLRSQLLAGAQQFPDVGHDYTLQSPESVRGRIAFAALPYLMRDHPFVQGITASAQIGAAISQAGQEKTPRLRKRFWPLEDH